MEGNTENTACDLEERRKNCIFASARASRKAKATLPQTKKRNMKKIRTLLPLLTMIAWLTVCGGCKGRGPAGNTPAPPAEQKLPGDRTIYGLTCEGSTDSVLILLPDGGGDPISYNILEARRNGRILGTPNTGDWTGVVPAEGQKGVAELVVDLDELKGIWCYIVMPKLRSADADDAQAQTQALRALPDSIRRLYVIPREYGFAMMQHWVARSVGYMQENTLLEKDNPVVYPKLGYFTGWRIWNGQLIVMSGTPRMENDSLVITDRRNDTCRIDFLMGDSLVLSSEGATRSYYRKADMREVNKKAKQIAEMLQQQALEQATK